MTKPNLTDFLRDSVTQAIKAGWSINQIAAAAGVPQPSLNRWYTGARDGLTLATADKLCEHFGIRFTKPRIPKPPETHHRKGTAG